MTSLHFLRPEWLWAVVLAPVLYVFARNALARQSAWYDVVAGPLRPFVLSRAADESRRWLLALVMALTWLVGVVAAAGPAWDKQPVPLARGTDALVIALDMSRSMEVADLAPSRLARARVKLQDILERRPGGYTALVVYSANAFTVVPLTDDVETIRILLASLTTDIMPSRGSYPAAAIKKAGSLLSQGGAANGDVLLIADGGVDPAAIDAAEDLLTDGHRLSVLAVGTPAGGPVPAKGGGFERDRDGGVAVVGLPVSDLRRLSRAGGGRFAVVTADDRDLNALFSNNSRRKSTGQSDAPLVDTELWVDNGYWLLLALLPLAALLFRRGWLLSVVVVAGIGGMPSETYAFSISEWFQTPDQRGASAFAEEEYAAAQERFEDPEWRASAAYRAGDFDTAAKLLSDVESARARFNQGNARAMSGDIDAAIESYEQALSLAPDHEDARFNKELLEQLKEQQESQDSENSESQDSENKDESSPSEGEGSESQDGEEGGESSDSEGQPGSEQSSPEDDSEPGDDGAAEDSQSAEASEEQVRELQEAMAQAREQDAGDTDDETQQTAAMSAEERRDQERSESEAQWLRRIEHDPGALLRRKFLRQYKRSGLDQDGGSLWPDNEEEPW